ncbi:DUF4430 domain-containing protein [Paenibacillus luteus]|uniref:DUF4430 domain-containing protein n=1 Tax=Paenibacillus luteus TaxID=2545753 RepID=UPI001141CB65|nr:DUF4430 domain-containing protein [Paenibacillus luteus]
MSKKKWLAAIVVIGVLAIAFFWGGNYPKGSVKLNESSLEAQSSAEPVSTEQAEHSNTIEPSAGEEATATNSAEPSSKPAVEPMVTPDLEETAKPETSDESVVPDDKATPKPTATAAGNEGKTPATKAPVKETSKPDKGTPAKPDTSKDKYLTDPVPEGKPKPVEWQDTTVDKSQKLTVTLSVTAASILDNMDLFNEDKLEVLPEDGIIYKAQKVTFYEGESVFDVLLREMKKSKIHMEFEMTPIYNSNYIEGINNIYEFDCGELSGWMYKVNGWFPNYGSSRYLLKDGDVIDWVYTCDLGRDIGGENGAAGSKG